MRHWHVLLLGYPEPHILCLQDAVGLSGCQKPDWYSLPAGIGYSDDKLLQTRIFSYADTQRHRLGPNYLLLPPNAPKNPHHDNHHDGFMNFLHRDEEVCLFFLHCAMHIAHRILLLLKFESASSNRVGNSSGYEYITSTICPGFHLSHTCSLTLHVCQTEPLQAPSFTIMLSLNFECAMCTICCA